METNFFTIDRDDCNRRAREIFIKTSGAAKEGKKYDRIRRDGFKMREAVDDRIDIKAAYVYYDRKDIKFDGRAVIIGGQEFECNAFEQIDPETVKGAYAYAVAAGDFDIPEEALINRVYADLWGSAFTDALRAILQDKLEKEAALSESFGPGFYGMDVSQLSALSKIIEFKDVGIELRPSGIMLPLKSCAGIYFSVTDEYRHLKPACSECFGTHLTCKLCQVYGGQSND